MATTGNATLSLNEEQVKLMRLAIKFSDPIKPDWEQVKVEGGFVTASAAQQRWGRLFKIIIGDDKGPKTPAKRIATPRAKKTNGQKLNTPDTANGASTASGDAADNVQETPTRAKKRLAREVFGEEGGSDEVKKVKKEKQEVDD